MDKPLKFDPSKVAYVQRFRHQSRIRKDGSKYKSPKSGPYWYANDISQGTFKTYYLGRDLPAECIPYAPPYNPTPIELKPGPPRLSLRGASDSLLEALDRGEQVVIDLNQIAKDCNAYVDNIGNRRYVIYRDPQ